MAQRLSGREVEARLSNGTRLLFERATLNTDDGITPTKDQGYPNGWVSGEIQGDGEIEVSTETMLELQSEAGLAGSWEGMPEFDLTFYAKVGDLELDVKAFGCKFRFPSFEFNGAGGEKVMHTIAFVVSSPDFVELNGVPLARRQ